MYSVVPHLDCWAVIAVWSQDLSALLLGVDHYLTSNMHVLLCFLDLLSLVKFYSFVYGVGRVLRINGTFYKIQFLNIFSFLFSGFYLLEESPPQIFSHFVLPPKSCDK